jgi:hypothetical protein
MAKHNPVNLVFFLLTKYISRAKMASVNEFDTRPETPAC